MNAMHNAPASDPSLVYPSPLKEFWQAFAHNKGALGGLLFMLLIVFCALFAPWVAPYDPSEQFRDFLLTPPSWLEGGQARFLLGTDELGRDLLSRLIHGARLSLLIGLSSVVISLIPGILLGLLAGFSPNRAGPLIMRLMDIMLALPSLLLAVAIVAILGPGLINTVIAIAIVSLPAYVRLTRAAVMTELNRDYVTALAPGRRRHPATDVRLRAAELHGAADRPGHPELLFGDPRRRRPRLPRPRRATADPRVGHHARLRPRLHRARLVGGQPARPDHPAQRTGDQPDGRRPARRPRSETEERGMRSTTMNSASVSAPQETAA